MTSAKFSPCTELRTIFFRTLLTRADVDFARIVFDFRSSHLSPPSSGNAYAGVAVVKFASAPSAHATRFEPTTRFAPTTRYAHDQRRPRPTMPTLRVR